MKTTRSAMRIAILLAAFGIGLIGLMAKPIDDSPLWLELFVASKAAAAGAFYAFWRLYERWKRTDKWVGKYDKACSAEDDRPNPLWTGEEDER